ncbi:hypothetical protein ACVPOS_15595 [Staphylococcus aureus]
MRIIANSNDDISLKLLLMFQKRGVGPSSVEKVQNYALQNNISMFDALGEADFIGSSKKVTQECLNFYELIQLYKNKNF